jgi:hypothetical protein
MEALGSCLVDADRTCTEEFCDSDLAEERSGLGGDSGMCTNIRAIRSPMRNLPSPRSVLNQLFSTKGLHSHSHYGAYEAILLVRYAS